MRARSCLRLAHFLLVIVGECDRTAVFPPTLDLPVEPKLGSEWAVTLLGNQEQPRFPCHFPPGVPQSWVRGCASRAGCMDVWGVKTPFVMLSRNVGIVARGKSRKVEWGVEGVATAGVHA